MSCEFNCHKQTSKRKARARMPGKNLSSATTTCLLARILLHIILLYHHTYSYGRMNNVCDLGPIGPSSVDFVVFADPKGIVTPTIVEYTSHVSVAQDEGAVLLCIAQGCPSLDYRYLPAQQCVFDSLFDPHPPFVLPPSHFPLRRRDTLDKTPVLNLMIR